MSGRVLRLIRSPRFGMLIVALLVVIVAGLVIGLRSHPRASAASGVGGYLPDDRIQLQPQEVTRQPVGSPQRAFLDYWLDLQHEAFVDALRWFSPHLAACLGQARIVTALQSEAPFYASSRPNISFVNRSGTSATILYRARSVPSPNSTSLSVTWMLIGGKWRLAYDPFLNEALRQAAENAISPGTAASKQALLAGEQAARLQSGCLQTHRR